METKLERLNEVLAPEFISGLQSWSIDELRDKRKEAEDLESAISYARRLIQGKIDVCKAQSISKDNLIGDEPLDDIKEAITDHTFGATTRIAYNDISDGTLIPTNDEISNLLGFEIELLPESQDTVDAFVALLEAGETNLSEMRHRLHKIIDMLRAQIVSKYQSGQANVEEILSPNK